MTTKAEFIAQYQADPQYASLTKNVDGLTVPLTSEERLSLFDQWADAAVIEENRQLAIEFEKELRRQVRIAKTALTADIARLNDGQAMSTAQLRPIVYRMARIEEGIIDTLISLKLLENEE
jgi:hypothetical protein